MPESTVCEIKLVPSITVDVHPTIEAIPVKQVDLAQEEELPHKRIVRNLRKLLQSKPSKLELENILTSLPRGSRPKRNYENDSD